MHRTPKPQDMARHLLSSLTTMGFGRIRHQQALELVAHMHGYPDWKTMNALQASTDKPPARREPRDEMLHAYITAALWSTSEDGLSYLDALYSHSNLSKEALARCRADCAAFRKTAKDLIERSGQSDSQVGHDFWLTRNRHGAGFWDRGLTEDIGNGLTAIAHSFGEQDLYVGDDGKLYVA